MLIISGALVQLSAALTESWGTATMLCFVQARQNRPREQTMATQPSSRSQDRYRADAAGNLPPRNQRNGAVDCGRREAAGSRASRDGDTRARDRMVRANLRLVVNIARGYTGKGLSLQDLIEEGNLGSAARRRRFRSRRGDSIQHLCQLLDQAIDQASADQLGQDDSHSGLHGRIALEVAARNDATVGRTGPHADAGRDRSGAWVCPRRSCRSSRRRSRSTTPRRKPISPKPVGRWATW